MRETLTPLTGEDIRQEVAARVAEEKLEYGTPTLNNGGLSGEYVDQCAKDGELGDARLFIQLVRDRFCYDHAAGRWFRFTGHVWEEDLLGEVTATLQEVSETYTTRAKEWAWIRLKAAREQDKELEKRAAVHENLLSKKISSLQQMKHLKYVLSFAAAGAESLGLKGSEFDANPSLLACSNGVLDLNTFQFRPGRPGDLLRSPCPTEWRGLEEEAPTWERFLREIFNGNDKLVSFIQRVLGYALSGTVLEHVLLVLYGPQGRNGKGTFLETTGSVLGPRLSGPVSGEFLLAQGWPRSADQASPTIVSLLGKRIVWASETDEGRALNGGRVKWLCGGDTLTGRSPYGRRNVTFRPTHTLLLLTNHKPRVDAEDAAIWERIMLVPFDVRFVDNPEGPNERFRDKDLPEKLKAEASGILAWLVRGLAEWREQGLAPPEMVRGATKEYRKGEDVLQHFLDEKCIEADHAESRAGELYECYRAWTASNGHMALSSTRFGKRIQERFPRERRGIGNVYLGIGLLDKR